MKQLGKHIAPPRFDDEEKDRLANILIPCLLLWTGGRHPGGSGDGRRRPIRQNHRTGRWRRDGLLLLLLLHSGRLRTAIFLTFLSLLALTTILLYTGGGIHDLASMLYPVIIVIAGLLLRPKEFLAIVVLSMLSAAFIILAEDLGADLLA